MFGYLPLIFSPLWYYTFLRDLTSQYIIHKKNLKNPDYRNQNKGKATKQKVKDRLAFLNYLSLYDSIENLEKKMK